MVVSAIKPFLSDKIRRILRSVGYSFPGVGDLIHGLTGAFCVKNVSQTLTHKNNERQVTL